MKVLVSGGGTGGHIYPALAVATQLVKQYQAEILYLGSDDGLENELAPAAGFPLVIVKAGKLRRYISWQTLTGVARIPVGMAQAVGIVRKFNPAAGLGARLNGAPLLMHQQDVPPNLSNRLIAPLATRISVAFADSLAYFPARKTLQLGNPVRQEMLDMRSVSPQEARRKLELEADLPVLLVTGGSQGARHLNQVVCRALPELLTHCQVLQISGKYLYEETRELSGQTMSHLPEDIKRRYRLVPYLNAEMPAAIQAAELVLCRSGAATLSELAVLGKPSLLVPLPPAIGSSPQEANAEMFGRGAAAQVLRDADLEPEILVKRVISILSSKALLASMSEATRAFAKPDATQDIVAEVMRIAHQRSVKQHNHEGVSI